MIGSILGFDDQDRAGRVGDHRGGGAAQEGPGLARQAATADDDEVGLLIFGRVDSDPPGGPGGQDHLGGDALGLGHFPGFGQGGPAWTFIFSAI